MRSSGSESNVIVKLLRNVVLILMLVVFASIVYNFRTKESRTESALMSSAADSREIKGVFIRDEQVVTYSGNGVISYSVSDGGKVASGSVIAQVYENDEQIKTNREVQSLTRELDILNKIQNPGTVESAQPANISSEIEETYRNLIYCRDTGNYDTIDSEKDDFLVLLSTYRIVTDSSVDFTPQINDITNSLAQLQKNTVNPIETISSDRSAYFVSYCDGYEEKLTKESINDITADQIRSIVNTKEEAVNVAGKLIDGYEWYLAGIVNNSKKEYAVGEKIMLRFESSDETFDAEIIDLRDEGDPAETIIIVSCDQFNYDLVQRRAENVELIKGEYTGLKVPREAIRFRDIEERITDEETKITSNVVTNYKGVWILEGEQKVFKKLDVVYEGSDYVLSAIRNDDSSYLALYDDILVDGDDSDG